MGWLFKPGSNRKRLIEERKTGWERQQANGTFIKSTCLAACYRGNPFSGVLWSVWERTFEKDDQQVEPTQRWITCDLLRYDRCDEGWGYKDMEESMHPYFYSCPLAAGLDNGKDKPPVKCFTSILDAGVMLNGFYRDGVVYINADLGPGGSADIGQLSNRLLKVALEELAHFTTGATDNSRDFQDYLLDLAVKISRVPVES